MKKILLAITIIAFASCKTERIYLIAYPVETEYSNVVVVKRNSENRFTQKFHAADSVFEKASEDAARSAFEKTYHLLPEWYKRKYINE